MPAARDFGPRRFFLQKGGTMKDFSEALKQVPESPGVYLMRDKNNVIIYVGKAINLRRRVRSYFTPSSHGKSPKVLAMVEHVDHFEYIVVDNEVEALVLESNFIKAHRPHYNIILRDDKQYPYICIPQERYPRLLKVRQTKSDGGEYFGPFPNAYAVNDTIRLLQRLFGIRSCRLDFDHGARLRRPCLNYDLGQCPAPCVGLADEKEYAEQMDRVRDILKGNDRAVREQWTGEMHAAAENLEYERAARFRDALNNLDALQEKQKVTLARGEDCDVIAMARGTTQVILQVFFVRGGKVVDRRTFRLQEEFQESAEVILSSFLKQFYLEATYIPAEIYMETEPEDGDAIAAFLGDRKGHRVHLHVPRRGDKKELLRTAQANAEEQLTKAMAREARKERNKDAGIHALEAVVQRDLDRVEAYDISNVSGVQNVGAMVVFQRERKQPKEYRKFKIRTVEGPDDYASQREMLERRFDHGLHDAEEGKTLTGFGVLPSVVLMDGGKGHVHVAEEVLRERHLDIPVVGMVKDDHHITRALFYREEEWEMDPRSPLYEYLYAVQEEVHRFAIEYHRRLRSTEMMTSALDAIPGIGRKRRTALLRAFGSVAAIKKADVAELQAVDGMTKASAEAVAHYFAQHAAENVSDAAQKAVSKEPANVTFERSLSKKE